MKSILVALFGTSTNRMKIQFVRYLIVGGIAFVFDFSLLYILTRFAGYYYIVSATISFMIGLLINYTLSVLWVFKNHTLSNRWLEFWIFAAIGIVGLVVNDSLMWLFTDALGFFYLVSKVLATGLVLLWNFFARKLSLFR